MAQKNKQAAAKKSKKPRSGFTQIYNAFLDSEKLTQHDKMVFIAIKSFTNNKTKQAYPSLATISRVSGVSLSQVRRSIAKMEEMQILKVESRSDDYNHGRISNLYTLYDSPEMWEDDFSTENEDFKAVAREIPDDILIAEYYRRHPEYPDIKKEPIIDTDQSTNIDAFTYPNSDNNNIMEKNKRQESYPLDFLKKQYDYDFLKKEHPELLRIIDYIIQIIYDSLNSSCDTIRVQKTDRPKEIVASQFLKLTHEEILYVIDKYNQQSERIQNQKAYLLTQLYEAAGQYAADINNQVRYDMEHWKE